MNKPRLTRRAFALQGAAAPFALRGAQRQDPGRPNIVLVMMDDFGVGQFAPHARGIETDSFDPAFTDYLDRHQAGYSEDEALRFARRAMPTVEQLARRGVVFSNAFASSNLCAPSRAGVLTGQLQNRLGQYRNIDVERSGLPRGSVLAGRLQQSGYATGFIGKWHVGSRDESLRVNVLEKHGLSPQDYRRLDPKKRQEIEREIRQTGYLGAVVRGHHPLNHGFDYYFGYNRWECPFYDSEHIWENWDYTGLQKQYNTELFTNKAIEFIRRSRAEGKPFFVEVAYHAVHGPLKPKAPERYFRKFSSSSYDLANFYAHVNAVDEGIAAIRSEMGDQWDNTLFFFCADNGAPVSLSTPLPGNAPYSGHKGAFLQGGIRVPMLVHWPSRLNGGWRVEELVSTLDIMPTALEAAGLSAPGGLDGRSMTPVLSDKPGKIHDHLLWAGIHSRAWGFLGETVIGDAQQRRDESPGAWVATDGRFLLRFVTDTPAGLYRDLPNGAPPHYELFDLSEDPGETVNLYEQLPQVAERLKQIYYGQARNWPPPAAWDRERWKALMPKDNRHLRQ